jgi:hypothetical protein
MKTQSVTLRLPTDILEAIEQKSGKGKRTEFIVQALRESLGIEDRLANVDPKVSKQVADLLYQFEIFTTQVNGIVARIEKLEEGPKPPAKTKIESTPQIPETEAEKGNTDSKTKTLENNVLLDVPNEAPKGSENTGEDELLETLQKDDPARQWNPEKLRNHRRKGAEKRRHNAGGYGFIYKGKEGKTHKWWVWKENLPHDEF